MDAIIETKPTNIKEIEATKSMYFPFSTDSGLNLKVISCLPDGISIPRNT